MENKKLSNRQRWVKLFNDRAEFHNKTMEEIRNSDLSHEEKKERIRELYRQLEQMGDCERRQAVKKRVEKMTWDVSEEIFSIKSGYPVIEGEYDLSRPEKFCYNYVCGLDEFSQDWQIDEYEKLNKKVWRILTRYAVSYINNGWNKKEEEAKQEVLTGIYRRMMILCECADMTFEEYVNLTDDEIYAMTFNRIYEYTLHEFFLSDAMGCNMEEFRILRYCNKELFNILH